MQRKSVSLLVALLMLSAIPLSVSADETENIPANAAATGIHNSLVAALAHADLVTALEGDGPFTVFAPTDDAFADAGIDLAAFNTTELNATLTDILLYHVYSGSAVMAADVTDGLTVEMMNGDNASFSVSNGTVMIESATVTSADVLASNGVIHVIDTVLMPPAEPAIPDIPTVASGTGVHTSLVAAIVQAGLLETLQGDGPFTVFAPTDQAFTDAGVDLADFDGDEGAAALANILAYHVTMGVVTSDALTDGMSVTMLNQEETTVTIGSNVMINDAHVTTADVMASNGVVHVIDKVLMPAMGPEGEICYNVVTHSIVAGADQSTCESYMYVENYEMQGQNITGCYNAVTHQVSNVSSAVCGGYMWTPSVSIAMTAAATTIHNSLVAALTQADLVATLSGVENYTVFAPTDEAFAAAGIDLSTFTTDEEIAALANILLYHVVPGKIMSSDLSMGMTNVTAANGDTLMVQVTDSGVMVGAEMAMVTLADVPASNGVIHVIDKVIMPPADEVVDDVTDEVTCDVTIGISSDGYAFSPASVTIDVNQTVCWKWTDSEMGHNVKEVDGMKSSTYVDGGITSGAAATTVDFHYTFTEDTIFYYACEPHISLDMFGKVTVGDGGVEPTTNDDEDKEEDNTPGFLGVTMILATLGAVLYARSNRDQEM